MLLHGPVVFVLLASNRVLLIGNEKQIPPRAQFGHRVADLGSGVVQFYYRVVKLDYRRVQLYFLAG
jgi:hypothetical protein